MLCGIKHLLHDLEVSLYSKKRSILSMGIEVENESRIKVPL
jgi:hypothetical protein